MNTFFREGTSRLRNQTRLAKLIYVLLTCFIVTYLLRTISKVVFNQFINIFALRRLDDHPLYVWKFITYAFIHADIVHLLMNLLMLYFFSILFTTFFTQKQLIFIFVVGSIFAGLFYESIAYMLHWNGTVVGASGGITSLLITTAVFKPKMQVRLFLFGQVHLYWIAIAFIAFDLLQLPLSNVGGHVTHLGGALFGLIAGFYIRKNGFSLPIKKKPKRTLKTVRTNTNKTTFEKVKQQDDTQRRIDEILDKISKSGYDSLSNDDKEFLFRQK